MALPRLQRTIPIVEEDGTPSLPFQTWWQQLVKTVEGIINGNVEKSADVATHKVAVEINGELYYLLLYKA